MVIEEILKLIIKLINKVSGFISSLLKYKIVYKIIGVFFTRKFKKAKCNHKYAILVAARNEEAVIGNLIDSVRKQDYQTELVDILLWLITVPITRQRFPGIWGLFVTKDLIRNTEPRVLLCSIWWSV